MIKAVIFDMDGLLINSEPLWDDVDRTLLKKRGYTLSKEVLHQRLGIGQHATVELFKKKFKLSDDISTLLSERQETFSQMFDENPQLMEGSEQIIKLFASKGLNIGVATGGHTEKRVRGVLKHFDLEKYFHSITTSHEVINGKPAPDIFLLEAKRLGVKPSECLVLEDAPSGVEAGKRAGMKVFGVNPDNKMLKKLESSGATKVFSSLNEISDIPNI